MSKEEMVHTVLSEPASEGQAGEWTEDRVLQIVADYDEFVEAAMEAAKAWGLYIYQDETAKAYVSDADEVVIITWNAVSDYDGYILESETSTFPMSFFLADAAARRKMLAQKKEPRAKYKALPHE